MRIHPEECPVSGAVYMDQLVVGMPPSWNLTEERMIGRMVIMDRQEPRI